MCRDGCVICLWHDCECNELMNLEDLIMASKESIYTMKDYADKRKSTNITRFEYCPHCGEKIDWKKIKLVGGIKQNDTKRI